MTNQYRTGGCQCGAVRFETRGDPLVTALCHCTMCRRANAAPAVAWAMYRNEQVRLTSAEPKAFASSQSARRGFCAECGTQICFTADFLPGLIDLTVGSFDCPEELPPALHYWDSKRLPWMHFADELPRYAELPPME
jgi:hypothetical protein